MSDDIEINLDDPEDIGIAVDDDSPISVEMPEGGMDGRSIHPAGEWSDAVEYAYLDLVTHEGSSYTAVRAVPAGTALTDTYYWQLTAEKGDPGDPGTPVWGNITGDLSDQTDLADALLAKAPVILNSASGSIASFADGSASPVTALSVSIEPVQDLHGYDNPWPAGGGKNIMPAPVAYDQTTNGVHIVSDGNGKVTINGTSTSSVTVNINLTNSFILPETSYLHCNNNDASTDMNFILYANGVQVKNISLPTKNYISAAIGHEGEIGSKVQIYILSNRTVNLTLYPSVEITNEATSWTPFSNICPISGRTSATVTRTGKNVLPNNLTWTRNNSGNFYPGTIDTSTNRIRSNSFPIKSGTYTLSGIPSGSSLLGVRTYDETKTRIESGGVTVSGNTFILAENIAYIHLLFMGENYDSATNALFTNAPIQLELSSTASAYEAPQIQQLTIDLDGTRYGGTLDVLTGEMTVTKAIVDLGTLTWGTYSQTYKVWDSIGIKSLVKPPSTTGVLAEIVSDRYPNRTWDNLFNNRSDPNFIGMTIGAVSSTSNTGKIRVRNGSEVDTPTGQLVYELATPITVQLTPNQLSTILGENHIWADTGDVSVEYRADTKLYIEKLTKPTEDDMTANTNISANTFFMVGNSLYFATSAIATGTTIVPGSNCTALSLAEALNNLNA